MIKGNVRQPAVLSEETGETGVGGKTSPIAACSRAHQQYKEKAYVTSDKTSHVATL